MPTHRASLSRVLIAGIGVAGLAATPAMATIPAAGAAKVFDEAKVICQRDAGALWGHSLCGPMMLVDPVDRSLVTNQAAGRGLLKASGAVFVGLLPPGELVANTAVEWSGVRWSQIMWPLPQDAAKRHVMLAHEMFHRIQPELGGTRPEGDNHHLDTLEGRYLLQLEWRALAKALTTSGADRRTAIADALLFRAERYRLFPKAAAGEAALESNEGMAEYTGVKLGLAMPKERVDFALGDLSAFVQAPTFVRSFAYATGPAYGLLLDQADPAWRRRLGSGQRFDQMLGAALGLPAPAFAALQARERVYDDGRLHASETVRDRQKRARLAALKAKLVDGPVLILPLYHSRYQFNPQTLQPLGGSTMVYPTMRLADDWGVLEVEDDALIDQARRLAMVSAAHLDPFKTQGRGWRLTLNNGWAIVPGVRKGDLTLKAVAPATGAP